MGIRRAAIAFATLPVTLGTLFAVAAVLAANAAPRRDPGGVDPTSNERAGTVGACCNLSAGCLVVPEVECFGMYLGDGTSCDPDPCLTGACCLVAGDCTITEASACFGSGGVDFFPGVVCEDPRVHCIPRGACCTPSGGCFMSTEAGCVSGVYQGDGVLCSPSLCPVIQGGCCLPNGSCLFTRLSVCNSLGGTYLGDSEDNPCTPNPCPAPPTGACCTDTNSCITTTRALCQNNLGGNYFGDGVPCNPNPCTVTGACCIDGDCILTTANDCLNSLGDFLGAASTCTPDPCIPEATGACCLAGGLCIVTVASECIAPGSAYLGDGTTCEGEVCDFGACCLDDGSCQPLFGAHCAAAGGTFHGPGVGCIPNPCGPGACCLESGGCTIATAEGCAALVGNFLGSGAPCAPNPCPGLCCTFDGRCLLISEAECRTDPRNDYAVGETSCDPNPCGSGACCTGVGSICNDVSDPSECGLGFLGFGTKCADLPCTETGACCTESGCFITERPFCLGTFMGAGTACEPLPCVSGACCQFDGTCRVVPFGVCDEISGFFLGENTVCTPDPCPAESVGACCFSTGACAVVSSDRCLSLDPFADFLPGQACAPDPCPVGACCLGDDCQVLRPGACEAAGGVYRGDGVACSPDLCPKGGCCFETEPCILLSLVDCAAAGGAFQGAGTDCAECLGACCFEDGECILRPEDLCASTGGDYHGVGSFCIPDPCPQPPRGACCVDGGECFISTPEGCAEVFEGTYLGDDTGCDPNPCTGGACCLEEAACQPLPLADCTSAGGTYLGDGVPCDPNLCGGACCFDGLCEFLTNADCAAEGGAYRGDGTPCSPNPCVPAGACCFDDGSCQDLIESLCGELGGTYRGDGTDCAAESCTGACCSSDGFCEVTTAAGCDLGRDFQGPGTVCTPNPCPPGLGACCFVDGACNVLSVAQCEESGGSFQGINSLCGPNPCPQPPEGACCFDGVCESLDAFECAAEDGEYRGDGTLCEPNPCVSRGDLHVTSVPSGAAIFLDGVNTGEVTPFLFEDLEAATYCVGWALPGYGGCLVPGGAPCPASLQFTVIEESVTEANCIFPVASIRDIGGGFFVGPVGVVTTRPSGRVQPTGLTLADGSTAPIPARVIVPGATIADLDLREIFLTVSNPVLATEPSAEATVVVPLGIDPVRIRHRRVEDKDGKRDLAVEFEIDRARLTGGLAHIVADENWARRMIQCHLWIRSIDGGWLRATDRVPVIENDGPPSATSASELAVAVYPNPFRNTVTVEWTSPRAGRAELVLFDPGGRIAGVLEDRDLPAGTHRRTWTALDGSGVALPSGVYYYRLRHGGVTVSDKVYLLR